MYLDELLEREAPAPSNICATCGVREGTWKCQDCLGNTSECTDCCRISHRRHPFHRVKSWTGSYFSSSWLWKVGTVVHLGHNGSPCPGMKWDSSDNEGLDPDIYLDQGGCPLDSADMDPDVIDIDINIEDLTDGGESLQDDNEIPDPPVSYLNGRRVLTFVHTNGIHQLPTSFCHCAGAPALDIQLLRMGLFPSTSAQPQTAFTFNVLDDYLLENLECKTSATHYYSKLRRMTSKAFPRQVKVCRNQNEIFGLWTQKETAGPISRAYSGKSSMEKFKRIQVVWIRTSTSSSRNRRVSTFLCSMSTAGG